MTKTTEKGWAYPCPECGEMREHNPECSVLVAFAHLDAEKGNDGPNPYHLHGEELERSVQRKLRGLP